MPLEVIGSGFGRTGTKSLKAALERLGFGKCHHMLEVVENPEQVGHWQKLAAGESVDWETVFSGYKAQVDWPGAHVWRELADTFPNAKVIHTVRPEEAWWASFDKTIGKLMARYKERKRRPRPIDFALARCGEWIERRSVGSSSGTTRRGPYASLACRT